MAQLALGIFDRLEPGPTHHERHDAQTESQLPIERWRTMWQAAMTEGSWAEWRKREV